MALLSSILGFSLFGLGARIGQLGIQKRNLLESAFPTPLTRLKAPPRFADFFLILHDWSRVFRCRC